MRTSIEAMTNDQASKIRAGAAVYVVIRLECGLAPLKMTVRGRDGHGNFVLFAIGEWDRFTGVYDPKFVHRSVGSACASLDDMRQGIFK